MFRTLLKRHPPGLTPPGALRRRADRQVVTWGIRGAGAGGTGGAGASWTRSLHLAPPFLLDDYIPRYQLLSSRDAALKRSRAYAHMRSCNLCPRRCGVNRFETTGMCLVGEKAKVNVVAPHFGEESCIQGHNGSGTVFMSGCNLRCTFCQNYDISHKRNGMDLSPEDLAGWYVKLQEVGKVHNINIVTPEHVVPQVALSILHARDMGLRVPIVYNTSSFDSLDSIRLMDGLVDIYLADFKVWKTQSSRRLLKADDYAATARESVKAMHEQVGDLCFTADGIAKRGLLVRHLVMPGKEDEGADIMRFLARDVSQDCFVHIMEQYHPDAYVGKKKNTRRGRRQPQQQQQQQQQPKQATAQGRTASPSPSQTHGADEQTSTEDAEPQDEVRYAEINRAVNESEISFVRKAAVEAGLWRFEEAPNHAGFPI